MKPSTSSQKCSYLFVWCVFFTVTMCSMFHLKKNVALNVPCDYTVQPSRD